MSTRRAVVPSSRTLRQRLFFLRTVVHNFTIEIEKAEAILAARGVTSASLRPANSDNLLQVIGPWVDEMEREHATRATKGGAQ